MSTQGWDIADRISDRIVAIINDELEQMRKADRVDQLQLLAGQLLAYCALQRTMPPSTPESLDILTKTIHACLSSLFDYRSQKQ